MVPALGAFGAGANVAFIRPDGTAIASALTAAAPALVVPSALAEQLLERTSRHVEWEEFARIRLSEGGDLRKYYPLTPAAEDEYRKWVAAKKA